MSQAAFLAIVLTIFLIYVDGFVTSWRKPVVTSWRKPVCNTYLHAKKVHKVTILHDDKEQVLDVREDCTILEAALDAGIDLPHDCKLGVCLTCPSRVVSGEVDHTGSTLEVSVQNDGFALTCCVYPRSNMVIKSIDEDELVSAQFKRNS